MRLSLDALQVLDAIARCGSLAAAAVERRVRTLGRGWEAEIAVACNELVPLHPLLQFYCTPDHPLAREPQPLKLAAIRRHRVVVAADSARSTAARSSGISAASDVLTVSSLRAKLEAQTAGLGVGFLPTMLAAGAVAAGQLVVRKVAAPKPRASLSVAWRTAGAGHAAQWFVESLQKIALT
jgi:DNA-binding transcriptional LysR family regulator